MPQTMWPEMAAMAAMWPLDPSQGNQGRKHLAEHKDRATAKYSGICGSSCNILLPVSFYPPKNVTPNSFGKHLELQHPACPQLHWMLSAPSIWEGGSPAPADSKRIVQLPPACLGVVCQHRALPLGYCSLLNEGDEEHLVLGDVCN